MTRPINLSDGMTAKFLTYFAQDTTGKECWEWAGPVTGRSRNRPRFDYLGDHASGHRYAYTYFVGEIPDGMELDHLCHNSMCVNPNHLEHVTPEENKRRHKAWLRETITHCPYGHPYSGDNLGTSGKMRYCKTCARAANRQRSLGISREEALERDAELTAYYAEKRTPAPKKPPAYIKLDWSVEQRCSGCDRVMVKYGDTVLPGTRAYECKGMCKPCYRKASRRR